MAQTYGYKPQKLGYGYQTPTQQPRQQQSLALAASGKATATDPFGLLAQPGKPLADGYFAAPNAQAPKTQTVQPPATTVTPGVAAAPPAQQTPGVQTAGAVYDINTDPALQQANAFIGLNESQAQAEALKQRQQLLLAYGDPSLAGAELGANDPFVTAAAQNPTSTRARLKSQHDQGLPDLTDSFNKQNLFYSGAHVKGEQQYEQNYLSSLADAAGQAQQGLGGIQSALVQALASGNQQRVQALLAAYDHMKLTPGVDPGAATAAAGGGGDASAYPIDGLDYQNLLARAAASRRPIAT